jgi:hypothetical protein
MRAPADRKSSDPTALRARALVLMMTKTFFNFNFRV